MDVHPQQKSPSFIFLLISRHPLIVLGVGWAIIMVTATFGLATLFNPGESSAPVEDSTIQVPVSPSPETAETGNSPSLPTPTPEASAEPEPSLPVFTSPAEPLPQDTNTASPLPLWTFGAIAIGCAGGSLLLTLALKQASASSNKPKRVKRKVKKRSPSSRRVSRPQQPPRPEPQVTVIPDEVYHPLDTDQEDLASEMDLRKRHSLSSLLRDR